MHGTDHGPQLEQWVSARRPYLDNLKVLLIAAIIALHAVLGYASIAEVWTYAEYREATLAMATQVLLFVLVGPFAFFLIALLFLVAGLLTPASLQRKGAGRFIRERLLRLGLPFVVYVLLVQPTLNYALRHYLGAAPGSYWSQYLSTGRLDTGPLWFVGVLLVFSVGHAAWRSWRTRPSKDRGPITLRTLMLVAVIVAPASFAVRLVYRYGSESGVTDLNFWEWPACIAVFALGVRAARHGWAVAVPEQLARQCRTITLLAALATMIMIAGLSGNVVDAAGGWHWAAAGFAVTDAVLTVFGSIWLLGVAQRRLGRQYRWGSYLSRSAYGAFMLQSLFLLGFAAALRPIGLPAELKALAVATAAVSCSFAVAWLMIRHVPGFSRVL